MLHKLLAGHRSHIRSVLSIMLCLALVCGTVASMSVFAAEPETVAEMSTETVTEAATSETTGETAVAETTATEAQVSTEAQTIESTEAISETATEAVTETTTEAATEAVTETEKVTEAATESTSKVKTEKASDDAAEETAETEMPAVTLTGSADGVSVSVDAPEGAFVEGVKMAVSAVDVEEFAKAVVEDCEATAGGTYTVYDAAAVEISFYDADGAEIQPAMEVEVTLGSLDLNTGEDDLTKYAIIYHMDDDGNMEYIADGNPGENSYTFSASSFSTYGLIIASVEYDTATVPDGPSGNNNTVDHIDIGITVTATLVINGEELTQTVTLTTSDFTSDTVTLTAAYSDGTAYTGFTMNLNNLSSSTGDDGTSQVRVGGSYYVGTQDNPVYYTFSLTKDVTFTDSEGNQYTVTMTFTATFSYWDDDNNCPLLNDGWPDTKQFVQAAGMDFVLTSSTANRSIVQIYKYVYDENGNLITGSDIEGKTYSFTIYDASGNAVETATVTVGSGGIGYYSTDITAGTYYLVETSYASAVGDKNYSSTNTSATYTPSSGDASTSTSSTTTTATMTVNSSGTTIYTINNYYAPSTTSITVQKEVTGNMGDTTKKFAFTLTDSDGNSVGTDSEGNSLNSFTLADGESQTIYGLTIGSVVYLSETNSTGYTVTVKDANGNTIEAVDGKYAITVGSGVSITVTNDKDVDPDTGINLDTAPYITILFGVVLLGTVVLIRRRRKLF